MASLADLRKDYSQHRLEVEEVNPDPFVQFETWFAEAQKAEIAEPNAMTLATVDRLHQPYTRVVLLKGLENGKFIFYTNYESRKGQHMATNPHVALSFLWLELERQVCIVGTVEKVAEATSDGYFQSRPRGSQEGAWVSPQSTEIASREFLEKRAQEVSQKYTGATIPRPPHWGGYAVTPLSIEFWQGRPNRLHDRILYTPLGTGKWNRKRLAP